MRDRATTASKKIRFTSKILPKYLRKSRSLEALIPWLYLKGVSTGDFSEALAALVGTDAPGLSQATISRLKAVWKEEYDAWRRRDLSGKRYVYFWADGIYFNIRMEQDAQCILVIIAATEDGRKELLAIEDGYRESAQSWRDEASSADSASTSWSSSRGRRRSRRARSTWPTGPPCWRRSSGRPGASPPSSWSGRMTPGRRSSRMCGRPTGTPRPPWTRSRSGRAAS